MLKYSATQCAAFKTCQRLYAYNYVEGHRPPSSPKQQFGIDTHTELENWLNFGTVPSLVAQQGIKYLPAPLPHLGLDPTVITADNLFDFHGVQVYSVEHMVDVDVFGMRANGKIDILEKTSTDEIVIHDHKTTSDLKYAMDSDRLGKDPAALFYALYVMLKFNIGRLYLHWIYYCASSPASGVRKPKGCREVWALIDSNDTETQDNLVDLVSGLASMRTIKEEKVLAESLPRNLGSCGNYGGCPHRGRCLDRDALAELAVLKLRSAK
jgi:hypothetical protein